MGTLLTFIIVIALLVMILKWGVKLIHIKRKREKLIKGGVEIHPNAMREEEKSEPKSLL